MKYNLLIKCVLRNARIIISQFGRLLLLLFFPLQTVIYPDKRLFAREKLKTKLARRNRKIIIRAFLSVFLGCIVYNISTAQEDTRTTPFSPKIIIKYSLLSHVDGEPAIQPVVEYIFKPRIAIQQQLGYIYYSQVSNIWGIRSRSELKLYLKEEPRRGTKGYLATEVLYKYVRNYGIRNFWREGGMYQERIDFRSNRSTIGFMPKIGLTNDVFKKRFAVDLAFGIGVKATYYNGNVPADATLNFTDDDLFSNDIFFNRGLRSDGYEVIPNFLLSLHLGFAVP